MPQYKALTRAFIAPHLVEAGDIIEYDGPPGPHLLPLDDDASAAMEAYVKDNPHATMRPVDALPNQGSSISILQTARPQAVDMATALHQALGSQGKPQAGLSNGGRLAPAINAGGGVATYQLDGEKTGSNAKVADGLLPTAVAEGMTVHADDVALGDPTKPGESPQGGTLSVDNKQATDKANDKSADLAKGK